MLLTMTLVATSVGRAECPGCTLWSDGGWTFEGDDLAGPDGRVRFHAREGTIAGAVSENEGELTPVPLTQDPRILGEIERVKSELAARGLRAAEEPQPRMLTTPLGEETAIFEYAIAPAEGSTSTDPIPPRGARLVRWCGPTLTLELEGAEPDVKLLTRASAQVLYTTPDCQRFNLHKVVTAEEVRPVTQEEVQQAVEAIVEAPVVEDGGGVPIWLFAIGGAAAIGGGVAFAVARKRSSANGAATSSSVPLRTASAAGAETGPSRELVVVGDSLEAVDDALDAHEAGTTGRMEAAVRALDRAVEPEWTGQPFRGATGVPSDYASYACVQDGGDWADGWLRIFALRPGKGPTAADVNTALAGVLGGRFCVGTGGFGALLVLDRDSSVLACPPGGAPVRCARGLDAFLRELSRSPVLRDEVCDRMAMETAVSRAGRLEPGQVFDARQTVATRVGLVELWSSVGSIDWSATIPRGARLQGRAEG